MHELSIAISIVDMAQEEAERHGGARVSAIHLKLGALSGIVRKALESSFGLACEQTPLEGSRLVVEEIPVMIHCARCDGPRAVPSIQEMVCCDCGSPSVEVLQGRELQVVALELSQ